MYLKWCRLPGGHQETVCLLAYNMQMLAGHLTDVKQDTMFPQTPHAFWREKVVFLFRFGNQMLCFWQMMIIQEIVGKASRGVCGYLREKIVSYKALVRGAGFEDFAMLLSFLHKVALSYS